ncbi:MAG: hypothetical protein R3C01_15515 [Planctomycetaceae bacterium]
MANDANLTNQELPLGSRLLGTRGLTFVLALLLGGLSLLPRAIGGDVDWLAIHWARATMIAQRNRMIAEIRQEIAEATETLKKIESAGEATAVELDLLASQLESHARALKEIQSNAKSKSREMLKIELRIIGEQGGKSEWAKKADAIEQDRLKLEKEFHRVLRLPKDLKEGDDLDSHRLHHFARLSPEQRSQLDADVEYKEAERKLIASCREFSSYERKLFSADAQWKSANEDRLALHEEEERKREAKRLDGIENRETKKTMKTLADLAAQARATIADGESQLRALSSGW